MLTRNFPCSVQGHQGPPLWPEGVPILTYVHGLWVVTQ